MFEGKLETLTSFQNVGGSEETNCSVTKHSYLISCKLDLELKQIQTVIRGVPIFTVTPVIIYL